MTLEEIDQLTKMIKSPNSDDFNIAVTILQNNNWSLFDIKKLCRDLIPNFMIFEKEGFIERSTKLEWYNHTFIKDPTRILKIVQKNLDNSKL